MVSATKDPLTFNDLMATPIDFSKYVLNGLKIENLTQDILLGPAFNLLKGTDSANITRKRSNPDKHGHENGKECTRAGNLIAEVSSKWST
ncbi:hypothetical protein Tco_0871173 [Tanacetum coccineum]